MISIKLRKTIISIFCCLNLFTVFFINRPVTLLNWSNQAIDTHLTEMNAWRIGYVSWLVQRYAHLTGLDNRWEMFSYAHRFNWMYVFIAHYSDSSGIILPLPLQIDRSLIQSMFADFREAKFHLNIYADHGARAAYADYLCRQYSLRGQAKITSIVIELHIQYLRDRKLAEELNQHLDPSPQVQIVDTFACS